MRADDTAASHFRRPIPRRPAGQLILLAAMAEIGALASLGLHLGRDRLPPGVTLLAALAVAAVWAVWATSAVGWWRGAPAAPGTDVRDLPVSLAWTIHDAASRSWKAPVRSGRG